MCGDAVVDATACESKRNGDRQSKKYISVLRRLQDKNIGPYISQGQVSSLSLRHRVSWSVALLSIEIPSGAWSELDLDSAGEIWIWIQLF